MSDNRLEAIRRAMIIPKDTKAVMTLYGVSVLYIGALFLGFFAGTVVAKLFNMQPVFKLAYNFGGVILALLLIIRVQPRLPAWRVIIKLAMQDTGHYYPISVRENEGKEKHKNANR